MSADDYFPTNFAKTLAREERLYPLKSLYSYHDERKSEIANKKHLMLKEFQQIAAYHDVKKAMVIYQGKRLSESQKKTLEFIAEMTPLQMSGITAEAMMEIIRNKHGHKDYSKIVELMITRLHGDVDDATIDVDKIEALVIKTTKR